MLRSIRPLVAVVLVACSAGSVFAQYRTQLPGGAVLERLGLERAWWAQATLDFGREQVQYFTSDEQATFVQSDSGMVTAIDNATGRRRWAIQVGAPTEVRYPVTTNEQLAMIVSGTTVYGLDKRTGDEVWRVRTPSAPSAAPASDDTRIYVGAIDGYLYAFSTKILDQLKRSNEMSKYGFRVLRWQYKTGGRIRYPAISTGNIVHVASSDGSLYGLIADECKLRYQFETDKPASAPLAVLGTRIFICTSDRKLYCVRTDTGALLWEKLCGYNVHEAPRVIGDHIFMVPSDGGLRCREAATGRELWVNDQANGFLAATPNTVYASAGQGDVLVLNRVNGRAISGFTMPGFPLRIANDKTDRMYFASQRGLVVCLRERDREFPLFHKVPEKRPVLPEVAPETTGKPPVKKVEPAEKAAKKEATEPEEEIRPAPPPVVKKPMPPKTAPKKPAAKKKPKSKPKSSPGFDTDS